MNAWGMPGGNRMTATRTVNWQSFQLTHQASNPMSGVRCRRVSGRRAGGRKSDDLLLLRMTVQCVEHLLDTIIVGIDQRVIQNDRGRPAVFRQQTGEGEPRQDGKRSLILQLSGAKSSSSPLLRILWSRNKSSSYF
jgi:hypothetical protein